jgi:hypothetical protein
MIRADRRKDMIKLRGSFRDYAKPLSKEKRACIILPRVGGQIHKTSGRVAEYINTL